MLCECVSKQISHKNGLTKGDFCNTDNVFVALTITLVNIRVNINQSPHALVKGSASVHAPALVKTTLSLIVTVLKCQMLKCQDLTISTLSAVCLYAAQCWLLPLLQLLLLKRFVAKGSTDSKTKNAYRARNKIPATNKAGRV